MPTHENHGISTEDLQPPIPRYVLMSREDQIRHRDIFRVKWQILRYENIDFYIDAFDEDKSLELIHVEYSNWLAVLAGLVI